MNSIVFQLKIMIWCRILRLHSKKNIMRAVVLMIMIIGFHFLIRSENIHKKTDSKYALVFFALSEVWTELVYRESSFMARHFFHGIPTSKSFTLACLAIAIASHTDGRHSSISEFILTVFWLTEFYIKIYIPFPIFYPLTPAATSRFDRNSNTEKVVHFRQSH